LGMAKPFRKMAKKWLDFNGGRYPTEKQIRSLTALLRLVERDAREDCAKLCDEMLIDNLIWYEEMKPSFQRGAFSALESIERQIRGGRKPGVNRKIAARLASQHKGSPSRPSRRERSTQAATAKRRASSTAAP
jgi:hypothetical protein